VSDWRRRTVLRGAEYVYEAVRAVLYDEELKIDVSVLIDELIVHVELEMALVRRLK